MISEQQRARDEAEKKVHALSRRMDHLERARREEEAPLLEAAFQKKVCSSTLPTPCILLDICHPSVVHRLCILDHVEEQNGQSLHLSFSTARNTVGFVGKSLLVIELTGYRHHVQPRM